MFDMLGLDDWTPLQASVVGGALLGVAFGVLAQRSGFCLRRALIDDESERHTARAQWLFALAAAIAGTALIVGLDLVSFDGHRFHASSIPVVAIVLGGAMFGAGMVLARGCASRLTVLAGTGNMRAWVTLAAFAIVAHAAMKGVLVPMRVWLSSHTLDVGAAASLGESLGNAWLLASVLALAIATVAVSASRHWSVRWSHAAYGVAIGLLVPLAWLTTGHVLVDDFDPIPLESLAFTAPAGDSLFYAIAASAIEPGFGVGLFAGVIGGSALAAILAGQARWVGFTSGLPVGRYLAGGALMGAGGVLAGGCSVGAGLAGVSTLSVAAIIALASIIAGACAAQALATRRREPTPQRTDRLVPAE